MSVAITAKNLSKLAGGMDRANGNACKASAS
jgi:hypothetical protein